MQNTREISGIHGQNRKNMEIPSQRFDLYAYDLGAANVTITGKDTFGTRRTLDVAGKSYDYFSLEAAQAAGIGDISRLPYSLKVVLENMIRRENGRTVTVEDIKAIGAWLKTKTSTHEIAYFPARVLMQDFTGIPAVVDLASMRDAMVAMGGDPKKLIRLPLSIWLLITRLCLTRQGRQPRSSIMSISNSNRTWNDMSSSSGVSKHTPTSVLYRQVPVSATRLTSSIYQKSFGPTKIQMAK
jgi:hypothetical protein